MQTIDAQELYSNMMWADEAFSNALRHAYGKRAGTMRYLTMQQTPAIQKLGKAYQDASAAWCAMCEAQRATAWAKVAS